MMVVYSSIITKPKARYSRPLFSACRKVCYKDRHGACEPTYQYRSKTYQYRAICIFPTYQYRASLFCKSLFYNVLAVIGLSFLTISVLCPYRCKKAGIKPFQCQKDNGGKRCFHPIACVYGRKVVSLPNLERTYELATQRVTILQTDEHP